MRLSVLYFPFSEATPSQILSFYASLDVCFFPGGILGARAANWSRGEVSDTKKLFQKACYLTYSACIDQFGMLPAVCTSALLGHTF